MSDSEVLAKQSQVFDCDLVEKGNGRNKIKPARIGFFLLQLVARLPPRTRRGAWSPGRKFLFFGPNEN